MQTAQRELCRICSASNPHAKDVNRYYFLDRDGTNMHGDTALHRILALHVAAEAIICFLQHLELHSNNYLAKENGRFDEMPQPPSLTQQNDLGCTALHVAVHRNSWPVLEVVNALLLADERLASIPMYCGTYPLHVATGHSMTLNPHVIDAILDADPSVCRREDASGDTPLSLLWKNVLRFRWARQWEGEGRAPELLEDEDSGPSWMAVISPSQFRQVAIKLVSGSRKQTTVSWHDVCRTPRLPPLLLRLLLDPRQHSHVTGSLLDRDGLGRTPLHAAASVAACSWFGCPDDVSQRSVLELLLQEAPGAAAVMDATGALPLHCALRVIPRDCDVKLLVAAFPDALRFPDPVTGLYPVQQLALRRQGSDESLELMFEMLRAEPGVALHLLRNAPSPGTGCRVGQQEFDWLIAGRK